MEIKISLTYLKYCINYLKWVYLQLWTFCENRTFTESYIIWPVLLFFFYLFCDKNVFVFCLKLHLLIKISLNNLLKRF